MKQSFVFLIQRFWWWISSNYANFQQKVKMNNGKRNDKRNRQSNLIRWKQSVIACSKATLNRALYVSNVCHRQPVPIRVIEWNGFTVRSLVVLNKSWLHLILCDKIVFVSGYGDFNTICFSLKVIFGSFALSFGSIWQNPEWTLKMYTESVYCTLFQLLKHF